MLGTKPRLSALAFAYLPALIPAQPTTRAQLPQILSFSGSEAGAMPRGWSGGPRETLFLDEKAGPNGKPAARLQRDTRSSNQFSSLTTGIPADFTGTQIELRGLLKTQDVTGFAGLWLREDGDSGAVAFDNMQNRQLNRMRRWTALRRRRT